MSRKRSFANFVSYGSNGTRAIILDRTFDGNELFQLSLDLSDPPLDHDTILKLGNLNRLLIVLEGAVRESRANRVGPGEVLRSRPIIEMGQGDS